MQLVSHFVTDQCTRLCIIEYSIISNSFACNGANKIHSMYVASFTVASAHKYETAGNVEGNDVILTEACGCPLHVLGPKVGAGTTYTHARTHTMCRIRRSRVHIFLATK